jgi:hypothetical protein
VTLHHFFLSRFRKSTPVPFSQPSQSFSVLADCEWRPSFKKGERNPVALLTIASTTHAVLIRLCRMRFRDGVLPDNLIHFFHEKHATFLGTGWTSDSSALEYSFGTPREVRPYKAPNQHAMQ